MNGKSLIIAVVALIGLTLTLIGTIIGATVYIGKLDGRIQTLEGKRARPDPWTGKDSVLWAIEIQTELQKSIPKFKIPTPTHHPDE